ncbi:MAG: SH3 domain-containing protein [Kineothrix sp.]
MKKTLREKGWRMAAYALLAAVLFIGEPLMGMAATATVSVRSAKVRKEPSTTSDAVAGVAQGGTVTITEEVKDSAGTVWYKVTVDNKTGYIRSDLVKKTDAASGSSGGSQTASASATPVAATKAYVNYKSVRVRAAASTTAETMGSVPQNTSVTIVGETKANDGKKWYEIEYTNASGNAAKGFVRSDLITVGEAPAAPAGTGAEPAQPQAEEPESAENPEEGGAEAAPEGEGQTIESGTPEAGGAETPAETAKPDYEMVFTENSEGVKEWYLYDNINGTRQTLAGLLAAASAGMQAAEEETEPFPYQNALLIGLAAALILAIIVITLMAFKIRDMREDAYGDYDSYEDEEEEEEDMSVQAAGTQEIRAPGSEGRWRSRAWKASDADKINYNPEEEEPEPGRPVREERQPKRKAKNFLLEDDEFEFEFLNMDD